MILLALSKKKHLPVLKLYDWSFAPYQIKKFVRVINRFRKFKIKKLKENYYTLECLGFRMTLLRYHAVGVINEFEEWQEYYQTEIQDGKTVLDVGSGCGETALLFYKAGAKKVIGIESDPEAVRLSKENILPHYPNFEIRNELFSLDHLNIDHDFLKMDIEGGERLLLDYRGELKPCAIEAHEFLGRQLVEKFHLRVIKEDYHGLAILQSLGW